jgi:bZIP transcription factor
MAHSSYSPYPAPSVDSASDYSPEPQSAVTPKRRARGAMTAEERREARAHRNRLAAQSSRDRKKVQFEALSTRVSQLEHENRSLRLGLSTSSSSSVADDALAKENAELRARIQQLEQAWQNMTKILGTMILPSQLPVQTTSTPSGLNLPLSPAPSSSSPGSSESLDLASEPTCELARFVNVSIETSLQRVAPSARSSIIRLLSEQKNNWERARCTRPPPSPVLMTNGPSVLCF